MRLRQRLYVNAAGSVITCSSPPDRADQVGGAWSAPIHKIEKSHRPSQSRGPRFSRQRNRRPLHLQYE